MIPFVHGSIAWWMGNSNEQSNMYDWKGSRIHARIRSSLHPRREWGGHVDIHQERDVYAARELQTKPARWIESKGSEWVVIDHFPFEVREQGWGEFEVEVKVEFKNDAELPVTFTHFLKLHPFNGEPSRENVVRAVKGE